MKILLLFDKYHKMIYIFMTNVFEECMSKVDVLKDVSAVYNGMVLTPKAESAGVSRSMLSDLCKQGELVRVAQGQYVLPDVIPDEIFMIASRSSNLIISHETALFLHGLSERTPFEHSITVPFGKAPSASLKKSCKVYTCKPELFNLGVTDAKTPLGNSVRCYDMERTICDLIKSRSRVSSELLLAAIKSFAAWKGKDLNKLADYAEKLRVSKILKTYLEVLL